MDKYSVWFDQFQRFQAIADLINETADNQPQTILDVGSLTGNLSHFLVEHEVTPWNGIISPQGSGLEFPDNHFDIITAVDVLEHVPAEDREYFISELARAAKKYIILAFPTSESDMAEKFILSLTPNPWLEEHQKYGLPERKEVESILEKLNLTYTCRSNSSLASWTAMMLLASGLADDDHREKVFQFFNRNYAHLENHEPAYRYIYNCRID